MREQSLGAVTIFGYPIKKVENDKNKCLVIIGYFPSGFRLWYWYNQKCVLSKNINFNEMEL